MNKLSFSGHESFICKQFWLKKVFDFVQGKKSFADDIAVVDLGVGRNMVNSLRYWGRAFGIINEKDEPTEMAKYLFGKRGKDVYLEDFGTVWILHYMLLNANKASIYNLVFNEFRKERIDFTKEQLLNFCIRKAKEYKSNTENENTIERDISIFLRTYAKPSKDDKVEIEDDFSGVLIDLDLLKRYKQRLDNSIVNWYKIEGQDRIDLPYQIALYAILDNYENQPSITFRELLVGYNSPGAVFAMTAEGLFKKLQQITQNYKQVIYTETAGNQLLQFKKLLNKEEILDDYYG